MSNGLAIAAVTRTLRLLLAGATPNVTMLPLDRAREGVTADQLNVFLYATALAAAWRNADPVGVRPGETAPPALPLALHYLVTAYGDDEAATHAVLGRAMSILHDHPVLGPRDILDATATDLPDSDLHLQPEHPRVTPLTLTTDDLFKLWSGFSTGYRVSAAYEVSLVLIDSTQRARAPLPALRQGPRDRGPDAVAGPAPRLTAVLPPTQTAVATLGRVVRLLGEFLDAGVTAVRFSHPRLPAPIELAPGDGTAAERGVALPDQPSDLAAWTPGVYRVALVATRSGLRPVVGDAVPMALGARIAVTPTAAPAGDLPLTVECRPRLRPGARVQVLLGDRPVNPDTVTTPTDPALPSTITATFGAVAAGRHVVRLRVDGADSDPTRFAGSPPLAEFDPAAQVVVS